MTPYEREQLEILLDWQATQPPPVARWFSRAAGPASRAVQRAIPGEVLSFAVGGLQAAAARMVGERALLKHAGIDDFKSLKEAPLERCDALASHVRTRGAMIGAGVGGVFGIAGAAGMVADVPTLLTLAFRTIQRVALCYGETGISPERHKRLVASIFALASANTLEEKQEALRALQDPANSQLEGTALREGVERATEREIAKESATASLNNLAATLTRTMGRRKSAMVLPVLGAAIGSSVNAWYLYDVATVARYCFQERWLRRRHPDAFHTLQVAAVPLPPPQEETNS